jgi:hypothetical protein
MNYEDHLTLREARQRYFAANGFGDGGYENPWVKLQAGPLPIYFPNTAARVRAVKLHDLHHTATQYATTWTGEAEIAAWEIASGCAGHYAAWLLNLQALAIGLAIAPTAVFRAFMRGRSSLNLYRSTVDDRLLGETLEQVRKRLRLDRSPEKATLADHLAFICWSVAACAALLATLLLSVAVISLPVALLIAILA